MCWPISSFLFLENNLSGFFFFPTDHEMLISHRKLRKCGEEEENNS
jgi:hypothetical protein